MNGPVVLGLILKTLFSSLAYDVERPTKTGPVGGRWIQVLGTMIEEYRGIPYAQPPVGELRFKPPVPAELCTRHYPPARVSIVPMLNR
ncbi:hypothetical protein HPB51_012605 [Rhipicephalus microplus]|uniref:Carboxylesterase type B domain-containing protein n=1 Tax=Rhipicephalus microplus TaxID=6941 RepID=A0A9J6E0K9_RHIMP|nr:hypothetical protein HPB51_012605 [Rhipicephalus microplus]